MRRVLSVVFTALFTFITIINFNGKIAYAENEDYIFSFDIDGYWKPTDVKGHDFVVKNKFGKVCYLKGFSFKNTFINDIETNEKYTLTEAEEKGIIDAYNVILSLKDDKYGSKVLYDGKLKNLHNFNYEFAESLCMEKDSEIKFNMVISMDSQAGNEYQNKHYVFSINPNFYEIVYEEEQEPASYKIDKVNQYFKTGQDIISIIGYEIMFFTCCFFIIYRIRQKQNVL